MEPRQHAGEVLGVLGPCPHVSETTSSLLILTNQSYTKPKGQIPDYNNPIVMRRDRSTVEDFCNRIHNTLAKQMK